MTVPEIGRQLVLRFTGLGLAALGPLACERVENVHFDGRLLFERLELELLTVAAEREDGVANGSRGVIHATWTASVVEVERPVHCFISMESCTSSSEEGPRFKMAIFPLKKFLIASAKPTKS